MECWKEEVISVSVYEKKHISERRKEPGKVKVKNLVGIKIMEVIPKIQQEMDARGHPGTLSCGNQHGSW